MRVRSKSAVHKEHSLKNTLISEKKSIEKCNFDLPDNTSEQRNLCEKLFSK